MRILSAGFRPESRVKGMETFTRIDLPVSSENATSCLARSGTLWRPFLKEFDPQTSSSHCLSDRRLLPNLRR